MRIKKSEKSYADRTVRSANLRSSNRGNEGCRDEAESEVGLQKQTKRNELRLGRPVKRPQILLSSNHAVGRPQSHCSFYHVAEFAKTWRPIVLELSRNRSNPKFKHELC